MDETIIILPAMFGAVVWLVYIVVDGFRRRQRLKVFTEFHSKLLDRIGSAREFGEFFSSDAGARFLDSLSSEKGAPQTRILAAAQWGFTLTALGIALFILTGSYTFEQERSFEFRRGTADVIVFVATVSVGIGIGSLVSAAASYLLASRMGVLGSLKQDKGL